MGNNAEGDHVVSFAESLCFEIATAQARLDQIEAERKQLKKKLKTLTQFLEEYNSAKKLTDQEAIDG